MGGEDEEDGGEDCAVDEEEGAVVRGVRGEVRRGGERVAR